MEYLHALVRLMWVKAGSPKSRETQGDGVPIVAKCSGQCLRHDEGEQGVSSGFEKVREMRIAYSGKDEKLESRVL